jgi:hypothetical protein
MNKSNYLEALERTEILRKLAAFDPHVVGTPPLGLDLLRSDVDVICFAPDAEGFACAVWKAFGACPDFRMWQKVELDRPIVAKFTEAGWIIEIFGQASPISEQYGWRHFLLEQRLLALGGDAFHFAVMTQRNSGMKTEPAFAAALNLDGDPYEALLCLERCSDMELAALVRDRGFG